MEHTITESVWRLNLKAPFTQTDTYTSWFLPFILISNNQYLGQIHPPTTSPLILGLAVLMVYLFVPSTLPPLPLSPLLARNAVPCLCSSMALLYLWTLVFHHEKCLHVSLFQKFNKDWIISIVQQPMPN